MSFSAMSSTGLRQRRGPRQGSLQMFYKEQAEKNIVFLYFFQLQECNILCWAVFMAPS
jgi:hypothetical protein